MEKKIYQFFADLIFERAGILYPESNFYQLENRLRSLAKYMEKKTVEEVYDAFQKGVDKQIEDFLIDLSTNNETSFFRDQKPFETVLNLVQEFYRKDEGPIRIWSAAASSGQEAYSVLMKISEMFPQALDRVEVFATDISHKILERARSGIYSQIEVQRGLPAPLLLKYFDELDDHRWQIKSELREKVSFKHLNLLTDPFIFGDFDIILCRNVLIYQEFERKKEIIKKLFKCLRPEGAFMMGSAENLYGLYDGCVRDTEAGSPLYRPLKEAS